ncbi:NACHT domain-containing protein [Saccharothrix luteola]|uniref:NACHT domain-containing protein n=1 Tax=Saccharothrix luteola TaxID=2893018 RepID=UPI001E59BA00|nr:ATP-binding protein [Saccharothrix luteola]MCC8245542.1 ATP-binding protein [Saccharothrix luteola]
MRRDPAISFRGALQILGHHDRPWLDRLNALAGGAVLAAGLVPAVSAVWGWVDQKNEAVGLLRKMLDSTANRLTGTGGLERHELVLAAHTTIVLTAFFETLRAELGEVYRTAAITDSEKVVLAAGRRPDDDEPLVRHLYTTPVPTPSAVSGFEEVAGGVVEWAANLYRFVDDFLAGLELSPYRRLKALPFGTAVASRYRSLFLELAAKVPEVAVWADLTEHAATRTAMARLERLLTVTGSEPSRDLRAIVRSVNRSVLDLPVVDVDADGYGVDAVFPPVEKIFTDPRYRIAEADSGARLASEEWWSKVEQGSDLDLVLARHFTGDLCARLPLLFLGHPGAGKSLLTRVLAARLPDEGYTVVRVALRRVDANTTISNQIQQALDLDTHGRVQWHRLVEDSGEVLRVVLLDGLDELLQATTQDRVGYLHEIAEFQRLEAAMGKPVAVVVTSRTLVADRVTVPWGTPVVKLEEFSEEQVGAWLAVWNEHNPGPGTRPLPLETALSYGQLARQPLLLLMLALYFGDPSVPLDDQLSEADLYERLFDTYSRREVTKKAGRVLRGEELDEAVEEQIRRLSTAALGMFNRGRQDISEADLTGDLSALEESVEAGERVLGEFFFVHAPEARTGSVQRSYEFLHATFGEYLVAMRVVEVLRDVAEGAFGRRRPHEPDDDLLFALTSHQTLAVQQPVMSFVGERLDALDARERERVARTLEVLLTGYRHRRPPRRFDDYRPLRRDVVRQLAAYSANLVLLLVKAVPEVPLAKLWPHEPLTQWRSTVDLWQAGIDSTCYHTTLDSLVCVDGVVREGDRVMLEPEILRARLRVDSETEDRLRTGFAVHDGLSYLVDDGTGEGTAREWSRYIASWLVAAAALPGDMAPPFVDVPRPDLVPQDTLVAVAEQAYQVLARKFREWTPEFVGAFVGWLETWSPVVDQRILERATSYSRSMSLFTTAELSVKADPGVFPPFDTDRSSDFSVYWRGAGAKVWHTT